MLLMTSAARMWYLFSGPVRKRAYSKAPFTLKESYAVETSFRKDVCPRENLPYFRNYSTSSHPTVDSVAICPRGYLPYNQLPNKRFIL